MSDKLSKGEVHYEHPAAKPEHHCGLCVHFEKPHRCGIVAGTIESEDWCERFDMRKSARLHNKG